MESWSDAYLRVWESFQQSETTEDGRHDTPLWRAHGGPFAACVIRIPGFAVHPSLTAVRQELVGLGGVRLHPDHFLHIMLQELGFVVDRPDQLNEISAARLEEFAQSTIDPISSMGVFPVSLGGVNSFQDAVFLNVGGGEPVTRLHERLFDLAATLRVPDFPYLPHCTIAHYDGTPSPRNVSAVLHPWRNEVFGGFIVREVEIVTLDPSEPYPELESYAVIPFAG